MRGLHAREVSHTHSWHGLECGDDKKEARETRSFFPKEGRDFYRYKGPNYTLETHLFIEAILIEFNSKRRSKSKFRNSFIQENNLLFDYFIYFFFLEVSSFYSGDSTFKGKK